MLRSRYRCQFTDSRTEGGWTSRCELALPRIYTDVRSCGDTSGSWPISPAAVADGPARIYQHAKTLAVAHQQSIGQDLYSSWAPLAASAILGRMADVTQILSQIEQGDASAANQLLPLVYDELRKLAAARMAQEQPGQTLQATALVHDAYVRLVDVEKAQRWDSRGHFFAAAAEAMRRILVEQARKRGVKERHGQANRVEMLDELPEAPPAFDVLALDEVLGRLQTHDPQAAEIVKLRVFAGLTHQEAAESLGVSRRVGDGLWRVARAWLSREMARE